MLERLLLSREGQVNLTKADALGPMHAGQRFIGAQDEDFSDELLGCHGPARRVRISACNIALPWPRAQTNV